MLVIQNAMDVTVMNCHITYLRSICYHNNYLMMIKFMMPDPNCRILWFFRHSKVHNEKYTFRRVAVFDLRNLHLWFLWIFCYFLNINGVIHVRVTYWNHVRTPHISVHFSVSVSSKYTEVHLYFTVLNTINCHTYAPVQSVPTFAELPMTEDYEMFGVLLAVLLQSDVFSDLTLWHWVRSFRFSERPYYLYLQGWVIQEEDCWLLKTKELWAFGKLRTDHLKTECCKWEGLNLQESISCNEQSQVRWCVFGCGFCWQGSESGSAADSCHHVPPNVQQQQHGPSFFNRLRLHRRREEPHQVKNSRL